MDPSERLTADAVALVERIRAGDDREAENLLVERYARAIRMILHRHARDAAEAEDFFQETFSLAVVKLRAGALREPAKLPAFLAAIARNLATEHYRKHTRRRTESDSEAAAAGTVDAGQLGTLLQHEEAQLVRRTLDELANARDREMLFRFYIAEETRESIAGDYGLTNPQFNRVLHRARQRYRVHFQASAQGRLDSGTRYAKEVYES